MRSILIAFGLMIAATSTQAQNRIDIVRPDAPELAAFGDYKIGVTTRTFINPSQIDVVNTQDAATPAIYDRALTVEIWYPAVTTTTPGGTYIALLRDGTTPATLIGQAARDAAPYTGQSFPLVILSHGYPGNRFLMSHLGENLASKGYVVASIDHTDSIYSDLGAFVSTLVNRPWDQRFVIDSMNALGGDLGKITDADNTAVIGYSMGGYGALIYAGAGVTQASTQYTWLSPQGLLERNMVDTDTHAALTDNRVKAFVTFGPWGNNTGFWNDEGLERVTSPLMLIAGGVDDVSGYDAIRGIFDDTKNTKRHLLTFEAANHNAGAPMPAPQESYFYSEPLGFSPFEHYADAVWDNTRMNNVSQHFITAYLDLHLKGDRDKAAYLDLTPTSTADLAGSDTYWLGFPNRTAAGLRFETKARGK